MCVCTLHSWFVDLTDSVGVCVCVRRVCVYVCVYIIGSEMYTVCLWVFMCNIGIGWKHSLDEYDHHNQCNSVTRHTLTWSVVTFPVEVNCVCSARC